MRALKRRLNHKNPNVQLLALSLTDICIKNGGDHFLTEVASREFIDNLVSILKIPTLNADVKKNILRHVQNWSVAFEGKPHLSYVGQVYKTLKSEGFDFPPQDMSVTSSAMVDTQTAPEWIDSDVCLRCRTAFSFTNRKHHCRNCGQVFDQACSSKTMPLPHFGITQDVRVCDGCYNKLHRTAETSGGKGHRHSASLHGHRHQSARQLADAELQRAIELSLQEVGAASGHSRPGYTPSQPAAWEPPLVSRNDRSRNSAAAEEEDDPELRAAIEASLREANAPRASAPIGLETPQSERNFQFGEPQYSQSYPPMVQPALPKIPNYDMDPIEEDAILTFSQTVDQLQAQGGRDLTRYPGMNELYDKANGLRPKLALNLDDTGRKSQMLTEMHSQLSEAVKLYDKILTHQVSQPRWQAAPQRQAMHYAQQPISSPVQAPPRQQSLPQQHAPSPQSTMQYSQPYYAPPQTQYSQYSNPVHSYASTSPSAHQQPVAQQMTGHQSYFNPVSAPLSQMQQASSQIQHSYPLTVPVSSPMNGHPPATAPPLSPAIPTHQPPQAHAIASPPPMAPSRAIVSPPPTIAAQPPRSAVHVAPAHQYRQASHLPQPPPPPFAPPQSNISLNQFPSAPTSVPQPSYPAYEAPVQQPERKEALLIDL